MREDSERTSCSALLLCCLGRLFAPERFLCSKQIIRHGHKHVTLFRHDLRPLLKYRPEVLPSVSASFQFHPIVSPTPNSPKSIPSPASPQLFPAPIINPFVPLKLRPYRSPVLCSLEGPFVASSLMTAAADSRAHSSRPAAPLALADMYLPEMRHPRSVAGTTAQAGLPAPYCPLGY